MKNKETLQAVMDRRLSFLDGLPSCRPALMQRIAQEEAPVMKFLSCLYSHLSLFPCLSWPWPQD